MHGRARADAGTLSDYAREAIARSFDGLDAAQSLAINLPGLEIAVKTTNPAYADACRTALRSAGTHLGQKRKLSLTIAGLCDFPDLPPLPVLTDPAQFAEMIGTVESGGLFAAWSYEYGVWQFLDRETGQGVQLVRSFDELPPWELSFPLRLFIHWGLIDIGVRMVHAGSLGRDGAGILLAGPGGSGKSGTVLAGLAGGLDSVGDDYVGVAYGDHGPICFPLVRLLKQDAHGLVRIGRNPADPEFGPENWQSKHEFFAELINPGGLSDLLRVKGIVLPHVTGAAVSSLKPATQTEALHALLPSTIQQLPGAWREGFAFLSRLVRAVPAYHLDVGADAGEIADAVSALLETLA